jgi:hypothetical protein
MTSSHNVQAAHEMRQAAVLRERQRRGAAEKFVGQLPKPLTLNVTETSIQVVVDPKDKLNGKVRCFGR